MSSLILFGAGASAFCNGVWPNNPPLGKGLFSELVKFHPPLANLDETIKDRFINDFEDGMYAFMEASGNPGFTALMLIMCRYFLRFRIDQPDSNFYSLLVRLLRQKFVNTHLVTLNYDTLLEQALDLHGPLRHNRGSKSVLKLHGSPTYIPDMGGYAFGNNMSVASRINTSSSSINVVSREEAIDFCERANSLAPVMAHYARGKPVFDSPWFIGKMQQEFAQLVMRSERTVIVGVFLNRADEHIWEPLSKAPGPVGIVNPEFAPYQDWADELGRDDIVSLFKYTDEMVSGDANIDRLIRFLKGYSSPSEIRAGSTS